MALQTCGFWGELAPFHGRGVMRLACLMSLLGNRHDRYDLYHDAHALHRWGYRCLLPAMEQADPSVYSLFGLSLVQRFHSVPRMFFPNLSVEQAREGLAGTGMPVMGEWQRELNRVSTIIGFLGCPRTSRALRAAMAFLHPQAIQALWAVERGWR